MTDESSRQEPCASRRCVLLGAGVLGAAGALTACSTAAVPYDANGAGQAPQPAGTASSGSAMAASPSAASSSAASSSAASGKATGTVLGSASQIPVGGGMAFTAAKVVVTQPTKGQYMGFSAVCTHVGCICNTVADGTINCPCHGSKFKITDGSVVAGPAPSPLPAVKVTVTADGKIMMA